MVNGQAKGPVIIPMIKFFPLLIQPLFFVNGRSESTRFGSFLGGGGAGGAEGGAGSYTKSSFAFLILAIMMMVTIPAGTSKSKQEIVHFRFAKEHQHAPPLSSSPLKMPAMQVFIIRFFYRFSAPLEHPTFCLLTQHFDAVSKHAVASQPWSLQHPWTPFHLTICFLRSKYKYRSSNIPSDNLTSPESLLHEESVVDRFIKVNINNFISSNLVIVFFCVFIGNFIHSKRMTWKEMFLIGFNCHTPDYFPLRYLPYLK